MKYLGGRSFFLRTEHWILIAAFLSAFLSGHWTLDTAHARELGVHGVIYPIQEEDPLQLIQQKLKGMEERGEIEQHNHALQMRTKAYVERPKPVEGIGKAIKSRVFTYDPTYVVSEDIKDHLGRVIHARGTKINPLETVSLSSDLLFINGDDLEQKAWAFCRIQCSVSSSTGLILGLDPRTEDKIQKNNKVRLILVKGAPLALSEEWGVLVYFDQGGFLCKKLGIKHVPAVVTQDKTRIIVEEVVLGGRS